MGTTTVTTCRTTNVFQETQRKKPYLKKCPVEDLCFCSPQFAPYFSESLNTGQLLQSRPLKLPPSFRRQVRSLASPHRRRSGTRSTSRRLSRSVIKSRFRSSDKPVRLSTRTPVRLLANRCAPSSAVRSRSLTQRQSAVASKRPIVSLVGRRMGTEARSGLRFQAPASRTHMTPVKMFRSKNWCRCPTLTARTCRSNNVQRFLNNSANRSPTLRHSRFTKTCGGGGNSAPSLPSRQTGGSSGGGYRSGSTSNELVFTGALGNSNPNVKTAPQTKAGGDAINFG